MSTEREAGKAAPPETPIDGERLKEIMPFEIAHGFQPEYTAEEWRKVLHHVADNNNALCLGEDERRLVYVTNESAAVLYLAARLPELLAASSEVKRLTEERDRATKEARAGVSLIVERDKRTLLAPTTP